MEPNGSRLLAEALTAKVKAVLADKTSLVRAEAAARLIRRTCSTRCCGMTLTTDGYPFRTCGGERTKRRRGSFWRDLEEGAMKADVRCSVQAGISQLCSPGLDVQVGLAVVKVDRDEECCSVQWLQ